MQLMFLAVAKVTCPPALSSLPTAFLHYSVNVLCLLNSPVCLFNLTFGEKIVERHPGHSEMYHFEWVEMAAQRVHVIYMLFVV